MNKFTFKTEQPTGRFRSFDNPVYHIKYQKKEVGIIGCEFPHKIRLQVLKTDKDLKAPDNNPNCEWKWIRLKKESESIEAAKTFLNENIDRITFLYKIYLGDQ